MKKTLFRAGKLLLKDIKDNRMVLLLLTLLFGASYLFSHTPCPMVVACGIPCPGCGLTRAGLSLLCLQPASAWQYNPCIFLWLPLLLSAAILRYFLQKEIRCLKIPLALVCILTIIVYLYRMWKLFPGDDPLFYNDQNLLRFLFPSYDHYMHSHFS